MNLNAFTSDPRSHGAAERFLHLAMEAIFDIGAHCIVALGLSRPTSYSEVIPALVEASVIRPETGGGLRGLAGFRNLLVHDYTRIDRTRVHAFLQTRLDDLRRFATDIAAFAADDVDTSR